jgi:MFS family permease
VLFALARHGGAVVVVAAVIVFAFGALGWNALVYVSAGEKGPPELAGQAVAIAATLLFVVSAACTPLMGTLASHLGWDGFWLTTGLLAAIGAAVAVTLPRGLPQPISERSA